MPLRDLLRRRRKSTRRPEPADEGGLTEADVQRLQRVQRATASRVKILRRRQ